VQVVANPNGGFNVLLSYAYADELTRVPFVVSVVGKGSATISRSGDITVADAPLTAGKLTPPQTTEDQAVNGDVVFNFSDSNPAAQPGDLRLASVPIKNSKWLA
jgi:hypothetical protein